MKNGIPESMKGRIVETPNEATFLSNVRSDSRKYNDIAEALLVMDPTKSLVYDKTEFATLFGKNAKSSLRIAMKKRGIKRVGIAEVSGKIYVFNRCKV